MRVKFGKPYILLKKYKSIEEMKKDRLKNGGIYFRSPDVAPEEMKLLENEIKKEESLLLGPK